MIKIQVRATDKEGSVISDQVYSFSQMPRVGELVELPDFPSTPCKVTEIMHIAEYDSISFAAFVARMDCSQ